MYYMIHKHLYTHTYVWLSEQQNTVLLSLFF